MNHDFILLDRSGSMQDRWTEAINSINGYVKKLAEDKVDTGVTMAVFDGQNGLDFQVIRERIIPSTWNPVTTKEFEPRGMTPLNDAIGRIVALAKAGNYDKLALIIMTDGHENASREDKSGAIAKRLLDECRAKGWQVIFLGADFDNTKQAAGLGNAAGQTVSVSAANLVGSLRATASKRSSYGLTGQAMSYSDEEKTAWLKKK